MPSSTNSNVAVVILHGSYHSPAPFQLLIRQFASRGIEAHCPHLPTWNLSRLDVGDVNNPDFDRAPPVGGYPSDSEDVDVVIWALDKLIKQEGKRVLLAAHSSGGWVATQAPIPELQLKSRQVAGKPDGLLGLFFLGAFVIPIGESVNTFSQPEDGTQVTPPFMRFYSKRIP
ncbi:hypothetical protein BO70DRAFT_400143 [Aspergillus heteromorphus CBS 117.55]|uniref:AB hydrolase-1 domain-containing protein n=1 Tax=Aspergillus heteromorphus CBS 117.55 TaxID=1448321 RepID=A0A317V7X7_9EURO|nr:uncharacterized protein BO70DRAFT_400143 [Aspergillus heteromorphus CBS 117.55]PWY69077.1 hypothetical protein BO70DRAFT_400143 [Aspergillus heteromorphus CBS 117.55]